MSIPRLQSSPDTETARRWADVLYLDIVAQRPCRMASINVPTDCNTANMEPK
jgi:hypothetical protein